MKAMLPVMLALLAGQAAADTWQVKCDYWSLTGATYSGPCQITSSMNAAGAYVEKVKAGDTVLELVEVNRQGVWSTYTIDGQPGVRFEHNRTWFSYSTLALDMTLDIGGDE